jgi:hypothetical protein
VSVVINFAERLRAAQERTIESLKMEWARQLAQKRALLGLDDDPTPPTILGAEDRDR